MRMRGSTNYRTQLVHLHIPTRERVGNKKFTDFSHHHHRLDNNSPGSHVGLQRR